MVTRPIRVAQGWVVEYDVYAEGWIVRGFNGRSNYGHETKADALEEVRNDVRMDEDSVGYLVYNRDGKVQRFEGITFRIERALYDGEMFGEQAYVIHPRAEIDYPDDYGNWGVGIAQGEDLLAFEKDVVKFDTKRSAVEWAREKMNRTGKIGIFKYTSNYKSSFEPNLRMLDRKATGGSW